MHTMDCHHRIEVPLRSGGGKKMKKRRELDALIAHSLTKRGTRFTVNSQDKLLSVSTDDPDDYSWMNAETTTRRSHRKRFNFHKCGPYLIGITTALFVGILYWLNYDLRQQISDYRQKVEEVSAMSKIFPDTLQQWHETTSFLIKNQTFVISQLNDLAQNVAVLSSNLSGLQGTINAQRNYGQDEKLVADFGAKLEAVSADIEGIKVHYNRYVELRKNLELEMETMKANFSQLSANQVNSTPVNLTKDVNDFNETMQSSFKNMEKNLMYVNNTLSQTIQILQGEIQAHKIKLDDLLDRHQNITSHVATLSNNWLEFQQNMINVNDQLNKLEGKVVLTDSKNRLLAISVDQLMALYKKHEKIATTTLNPEETSVAEQKANTSPDPALVPPANGTAKLRDNPPR